MKTYMIRTPSIQHVIKAYEYMKKRNINRLDNSMLQHWIIHNNVSELVQIKAIHLDDYSYNGYSTSLGTMIGYNEVINLEETVTL